MITIAHISPIVVKSRFIINQIVLNGILFQHAFTEMPIFKSFVQSQR